MVLRPSVPLLGPRGKAEGENPRAVNRIGTWPPGRWGNAREVRHRPAVKTSNPRLSPRGAGRAVGGIRAWAENSGRRASSCSTLLLSRAFVCADVKAVVGELSDSSTGRSSRPRAYARLHATRWCQPRSNAWLSPAAASCRRPRTTPAGGRMNRAGEQYRGAERENRPGGARWCAKRRGTPPSSACLSALRWCACTPVIRGTAARHGARPPILASVSVRNRGACHPLPRFGSRPANDAGKRTRRREHAARDAAP